ncbi:protein transport protein Sec61 subunit gamma-1 [Lactuca sativa]|uniref:protein transport protein Sec61 subunit gamma-1 n=1 Tax=Lactuca sativa TaxID=4236 RepID=UPI000CD833CA|nr:protein transport protein Sec61 subunit gamma-1 [Lactuca sativa]XP_042758326.1 protein transport protein Sec61 subunit gamma-1 [Lactuca sativa]
MNKKIFVTVIPPFIFSPQLLLRRFLDASTMDAIDSVIDPLRGFAKDSARLVKRCHKPDRKEFTKVASRTAIGFVVMGFVGFFVKLIFIPINNIIVGAS